MSDDHETQDEREAAEEEKEEEDGSGWSGWLWSSSDDDDGTKPASAEQQLLWQAYGLAREEVGGAGALAGRVSALFRRRRNDLAI